MNPATKRVATNALLLLALAVSLTSLLPVRLSAQTFTTLHSFTALSACCPSTNTDGAYPYSRALSDNTVYGAASSGGSSGSGTVFAVNTNGTGYRVLYTFSPISNYPCNACVNSDGFSPGNLILSGSTLYGATGSGGPGSSGTIFTLNTDGTAFATIYSFTATTGGTNSDGAGPGSLILSNDTLYGTTGGGGANGSGTIFAINIGGTGFNALYAFSAWNGGGFPNSDGNSPNSLLLSGATLYGTATSGGTSAGGTAFALNTDGTGFRVLHAFSSTTDGFGPGALVLSGDTLYGAASEDGPGGQGTVFTMKTNGTGFKVLLSNGLSHPNALLLADNVLYGSGGNVLFSLNTDGTGFATIYRLGSCFTIRSLIMGGNMVYAGATPFPGCASGGEVFGLSLPVPPPTLTIMYDGGAGYWIRAQGQPNFIAQLQRAPSLNGPWSTSTPQSADTNGLIQFHDLFPSPGHAFYRTVQSNN